MICRNDPSTLNHPIKSPRICRRRWAGGRGLILEDCTTKRDVANVAVAAVYDRRRSRKCCISGGHKTPPPSHLRFPSGQGGGFPPLAVGGFFEFRNGQEGGVGKRGGLTFCVSG